jgi:tRNA pseudouridine38-40 synthase
MPADIEDSSVTKDTKYRIALLVEYDGTDFSGFQIQKNGRSVQQSLEEALFALFGEPCRIYGCSRTDAGVHARGHISHVDVPFLIPIEKLPLAMNANLPDDVSVLDCKVVSSEFHARFHSIGKKYIYRIDNNRTKPCMDRRYAVHVPGELNIGEMMEAARRFEGNMDFSAFYANDGRQINPVRTMQEVKVEKNATSGLIEITVIGKSFLYNMVRIIAGTLVYVGQGKIEPDRIDEILAGKDRRQAGKTMPAKGLTLEKVYYEPPVF